jgi:DNA-binding IclR family transcriptional regulator
MGRHSARCRGAAAVAMDQVAGTDGVAAVDRALAILGAWRDGEGALPLRELAARTGLYKSTILRLLASLERARCVERRPDGNWALGPMLFRWGMLYRHGLRLEATVPPLLRALAESTGESASFFIREDPHRLCLFRADSAALVRDTVKAGDLLPLDKGAAGHVLREYAAGPKAGAPHVVITEGERDPELAAVAAPVFGSGGALVGALTISGPRARVLGAVERLKPATLAAAEELTRRLGGDL